MKVSYHIYRNHNLVESAVFQGTFEDFVVDLRLKIFAHHQSITDAVNARYDWIEYDLSGVRKTDPQFLEGFRSAVKMAVNQT